MNEVAVVAGWSQLRWHDTVYNENGAWGWRMLVINYDRGGKELSRKILEPACWMSMT
jgi:hypothetical protein